jgi:hypothetical protein
MAQYDEEMRALQSLMDAEESKSAQRSDAAKAAGPFAGRPRLEGAADVMMGYRPQAPTRQPAQPDNTANMLNMYKLMQANRKQRQVEDWHRMLGGEGGKWSKDAEERKRHNQAMETVAKIRADKIPSPKDSAELRMYLKSMTPADFKAFSEQNSDWLHRWLGVGTGPTSEDYVQSKIKGFKQSTGNTQVSAAPQASTEDQQALAWAKENPTDPRAIKIMQRLGAK